MTAIIFFGRHGMRYVGFGKTNREASNHCFHVPNETHFGGSGDNSYGKQSGWEAAVCFALVFLGCVLVILVRLQLGLLLGFTLGPIDSFNSEPPCFGPAATLQWLRDRLGPCQYDYRDVHRHVPEDLAVFVIGD